MSTITPRSCFALLLATSIWEELHLLVEVTLFRFMIITGLADQGERIMLLRNGTRYLSLKNSNSAAKR